MSISDNDIEAQPARIAQSEQRRDEWQTPKMRKLSAVDAELNLSGGFDGNPVSS
jgi:hypothetical protein